MLGACLKPLTGQPIDWLDIGDECTARAGRPAL
ncbi:MAG: hypothetical protein CM15mP84_03080 [Cellvibrionales bacterium]|nr:MAG: hypothetical protein CM15mP84_03080 [Cellvibrionales bacterium]